jgi:hypothetical protein
MLLSITLIIVGIIMVSAVFVELVIFPVFFGAIIHLSHQYVTLLFGIGFVVLGIKISRKKKG